MMGRVRLTRAGELQEDIQVLSYVVTAPDVVQLVEVGVYDAMADVYLPNNGTSIQWPGGAMQTPRDSIQVLRCQPGAFYNSTQLSCLACDRGMFQPESGRDSCLSCRIFALSYQDEVGQTVCKSCPANTMRAYTASLVSVAACECVQDYWAPKLASAWECSACPPGAACFGETALPRAKPGYWAYPLKRDANGTATLRVGFGFIPCAYFTSNECRGGNASHTAVCSTGFVGTACSVCDEGYYKFIGDCKGCGSDQGLGRFTNLLVLAGMIFAWIIVNQYV